MKNLIIGDIHGVNYWKDVIEIEKADKVIFIGDYLDSFTVSVEDQVNNFLDLLEYKKSFPDKVILLLGNHDWHYSELCGTYEQYSGFNPITKMHVKRPLTDVILDGIIQASYLLDDKYLLTHAGVSKTWLEYADHKGERIDKFINDLLLTNSYLFDFSGFNPYGDDVTQGPLWIRPRSLYNDLFDNYIQIVGHTKVKEVSNQDNLWLIDTFSERKEKAYYLIIENDEIIVKTYEII